MTKFETIGIEWQENAETVGQARRAFQRSCYDCCIRGITIECERCAINQCHQQTVALIQDMKEQNRRSCNRKCEKRVG